MRSKKRTIGILIVSILCLLIGLIFARLYYIKVENDRLELMFSDDCLKDNMGRVEPNEKYYEIMNSILGEDRQIGTLEDNICHYIAEKGNYAYDKETGYIDNEILIYAKDGISRDNVENLAQRYNAEIVGQIKTINYYQWKFNTSYSLLELKEICNKLEQESIVKHATINYTYKISSSGINYGEQWKQENWSETNISGSNWGLEAIKAISAWEYMEQMNPVRIGLIDTGFDANTEVETDKEFQNLIEQEKIQGTGHEDLKFSATYCNVPPAFLNADSHGTHVAGIMAATSDNSEGICGTYPYGKNNLYGVNCIGSAVKEETTLGQYQVCFAFLIENNVKVINCSIESADCNKWFLQSEIYKDNNSKNEIEKLSVEIAILLKDYIDKGYDFVIVQAAGNDSNCQYTRLKCGEDGNISYNKKGNCKYDEHGSIIKINSSNFKIKNGFWKRKFYYIDSNGIEHEIINMNTNKIIQSEFLESKYSSSISAIDKEEFKDVYDRIIVVGAVGLSKNKSTNAMFYHIWEHSNLGERIDIVAPGDNIYSTIIGGYDYYSGTSMAAPYISGTAAMVWSANNDLTGVQVKEIICKTANQRITSVNANSEFSKLPDNVVWYKMINAKLAVEEAVKSKDTEAQSTEPVEIQELNYTWQLEPTIEAEDIILSDKEEVREGNQQNYKYASSEYAIIKNNSKYGVIKYDGTLLTDIKYKSFCMPYNKEMWIINENSHENPDDVIITPNENSPNVNFNLATSVGFMDYYYTYSKNKNKLFVDGHDFETYFNIDANVVVEETEEIYGNSQNKNARYGIADKNGIIIPCEYKNACMNIGNNIIALEKGGKWGYFDKNGTKIIDFICEPFESKVLDNTWRKASRDNGEIYPYLATNGYIPVKIDGKCGYYDTKGNEVIPCGTFEEVRPVHNGLAWVKKDGKWGVIKLNDTKKTETDYQKQYYTFIENELIPKYGLANVDTDIPFSNSSGIVSAIIDDFSNTGSMDLLVVRLENSADSIDIVCSWYNWDGNSVVPINEITVESNYGITSNIDVSFNQGYLCFDINRIWLNSNDAESSIWIYSFNNSKLNPVRNYEIHRFHGYIDEITETIRKEINIKSQDYKLNLNDVKTFHDDLKSLGIKFNNDEVGCQLINENNLLNYALSVRESLFESCRFIISDFTDLRSHIIVTPQKITNGQSDYKDILFKGTVNTEKDPLNVRKSPSANAEIIGRIDKGSTVTIYAESGDWYEIEYNGGVGYVSKKYIKSKGNNFDTQTSNISDKEILKAVNKYLEENQSNLGVWLSDGNPYCPAQYMASTETKWSCPINLSWESYSPNEIAGSYPYFAYVDKETLICTITANYETVVEFDLSNYLK